MSKPSQAPPCALHVNLKLREPVPLEADFVVQPGHMVALVGPSGIGKSSVLRAVAGVLPRAQGQVRLVSQVWLDSAHGQCLRPQLRRVGYMPQQWGLFPHLSALANVAAGMLDLAAKPRLEQAHDWLQRVGLQSKAAQLPHQLSGGNSSVWPWRGLWRVGPRCCCWMSRFRLWIGPRASACTRPLGSGARRLACRCCWSRTTCRTRRVLPKRRWCLSRAAP